MRMARIHRTYANTEVHSIAVSVECPFCGEEWQEIDTTECGKTYTLTCENEECEKEFEMYFSTD